MLFHAMVGWDGMGSRELLGVFQELCDDPRGWGGNGRMACAVYVYCDG